MYWSGINILLDTINLKKNKLKKQKQQKKVTIQPFEKIKIHQWKEENLFTEMWMVDLYTLRKCIASLDSNIEEEIEI